MGRLHVCIVILLMMVTDSQSYCDNDCGCITTDITDVQMRDLVKEPLRTEEFQYFLDRMASALNANWNAYTFIYTKLDSSHDKEPPIEPGSPLCMTEYKHIFGYFKNNGLTLCWVVKPFLQSVKAAVCSGDRCCGDNTRCEPDGYVLKKFLVFCDAYFVNGNGCLLGTTELEDTFPGVIDNSSFTGGQVRKKRDADDLGEEFLTLSREKRECSASKGYFAFQHFYLPTTCSCRNCNC